MEELKTRFPAGLDYVVALDTTLAVTEGINEIIHTLVEALVLVIVVVFLFLQGWRATLIPLLAVPVSLIGTFLLFPVFGFSINTLSLFGLVLAIGLVVDDAIVVVEAVEHHIEHGMSPKEASLKAMEEVTGPVIGIALVLSAVFIPTAFIPGITGRLYQQFAVTIAVSVIISAFNALTLSPALSALLLRPKKQNPRGPLAYFFKKFNQAFAWLTGRLRRRLPRPDPGSRRLHADPGRLRGRFRLARRQAPVRVPPRRGPGVSLRRRAAPQRGIAATHECRLQQDRGDSQRDSRRAVHEHDRGVQPPQRRAEYLQRVLLRDAQGMEGAQGA
jgi:hypothetical protein